MKGEGSKKKTCLKNSSVNPLNWIEKIHLIFSGLKVSNFFEGGN